MDAQSLELVRRSAAQFVSLLSSGVAGNARVSPEWTIRDVAAHAAGTAPVYLGIANGGGSPVSALTDVAGVNQSIVTATSEQDLARLAQAIDHGTATFLAQLESRDGDELVPWHAGFQVSLRTLLRLVAAEGYVHGWDVARVAKHPWTIPAADARAIIGALMAVAPVMLDRDAAKDLSARVELRCWGDRVSRWVIEISEGTLTVSPPAGERVDCTVHAEPVTYLLVSYRRVSPVRAALTGRMLVTGKRPLLPLKLSRMYLPV
jgi:uncharacterized protein (TIGR03083 family)